MTASRDHGGRTAAAPADVPDWGSAAEPATDATGLPGNPGFLSPGVPAFAVRDRRGRALFRLVRSVAGSRDALEVLTPAAVLATPGMLLASIVAAVAAVAEVIAGAIALLWLAV